MSTTTIDRRELPPVPPPGPTEFFARDAYAVVTAGKITAEVLRLAYWDPRDGEDTVAVEYEVRMNGLPDTGGLSDLVAEKADTLTDLSAVCEAAATLLAEVQR